MLAALSVTLNKILSSIHHSSVTKSSTADFSSNNLSIKWTVAAMYLSIALDVLSSYVSDDHRKCERYLAKVGAAIRSSRHEVTRVTPNLINSGREIEYSGRTATVPIHLEDQAVQDPEKRSEAFKKLFTEVQKRIIKAHKRSRRTYNLRRRPEKFILHQQV